MQFSEKDRIAILGAGSGFGLEFTRQIQELSKNHLVFSRKKPDFVSEERFIKADFSGPSGQNSVIEKLKNFDPTRVFYFAGGGPHGSYFSKQWKDHRWAFEVSFLFPARIINELACELKVEGAGELCQLLFIGSNIAENQACELSASYAAAKTALRNLFYSLQNELHLKGKDLRLCSPGYMDTSMLPPNAPPRKTHHLLKTHEVAKKLLDWLQEPCQNKHLIIESHLK